MFMDPSQGSESTSMDPSFSHSTVPMSDESMITASIPSTCVSVCVSVCVCVYSVQCTYTCSVCT